MYANLKLVDLLIWEVFPEKDQIQGRAADQIVLSSISSKWMPINDRIRERKELKAGNSIGLHPV